MTDTSHHVYEFGGFHLDTRRRELLQGGRPVALFPRCFDALLLLIEHRGELLDKDFLLHALWPEAVVEENSLAKVISDVRRVLGAGAREQGCIATIPRRGYRFTAEVTVLRGSTREPPIQTPREVRTLAVLPFEITNPLPGDEFLKLGLADALITRLGALRHTPLRPTSAIARFANEPAAPADAARQLGVDAVITGSLRRAGDKVRVTVQLVAAEVVLWAEKFDADARDALELEDSLAQRVADALTLALTRGEAPPAPRRYTNDPVAYDHYLRGRYLWSKRTRESVLAAVQCFERAISIDPRYALAYSGLGDCWIQLGLRAAVSQSLRPREAMPRARVAAEKALAIDDSLAAAHATLGQVLFTYEWRRTEGLREFTRALELEPNHPNANHWYAMSLAGLGRYDEALVQIRRAHEIDPLSIMVRANIGYILYRSGRYDEAVAHLKHTVQLEPGAVMSRYRLALALEAQGSYAEALTEFAAMQPSEADPLGFTGMARTLALAGRADEARRMLAELEKLALREYVPAALLAEAWVALGEHDRAFEALDRAIEERTIVVMWLALDRHWDPLRQDPRFASLLPRVGL
jgi:DNA-binding winged helix-turn-helix (wHTH) protein/tetratricopeptide (TPR) repeat protein